ncbi:MAG: Holliday junction resolvase [Methanomassiliicoccales archaeon]
MTDLYERELKGILGGEVRFIDKICRDLPQEQLGAYRRLREKHFLVIKAGGSLGVDLIAVRGNFAFPIEVKSSAERVLRFSRSEKLGMQAQRMKEDCEHAGLVPTYAYRLKRAEGDPWRLFTLPGLNIRPDGIAGLLMRRLPSIGMTHEGNGIMRWDDGLLLSRFIAYFMDIS